MTKIIEQIKPETLLVIEKQANFFGLSIDDYLKSLLPENEKNMSLKGNSNDDNFEADMNEFAEDLPTYKGTFSREDIYFDHD
jgi:hypothetical protein